MKKYYKNIFDNKKINGDASLGAPDPFIIKVNGYYYLTCTRDEGLVVMKSFDLIHWENLNNNGRVDNEPTLKYAFAPEICYFNNKFYATASPDGRGHYIFESNSIEGPFEKVTDNFNELIDGSFFVDSDENKYFLRATETGIVMKKFDSVEKNMKFNTSLYIDEAIIGNWTEGPYLFKRYGNYYLTFTGTHFLSDAYRVNYASGSNIFTNKSLKHQDLLIISTTNDFYGLGHSMSILGPNLDSYYIVYHNMMPNGNRYMNISRLMFDNNGHMLVNGLQVEDNLVFERPKFETFINESDYLSQQVFKENNFSIEYNFKSENVKLILGYIDETNYQYLSFKNNNIVLNNINNDKIESIILHKLKSNFDFNAYHYLRIQYKDGRMAIYLDLIELNDRIKVKINYGKIGFFNNELSNAYLAYSVHSFGTSDIEACKVDKFYLANMKKTKNKYFTNIFIKEDGYYNFNIKGKKVVIENMTINNKMIDSLVYLKKGKYNFSINLVKGKVEEISYFINRCDYKDLNSNDYLANMDVFGSYLSKDKGVYFENDRNALLTKFDAYEYEASCDLQIIGNPIKDEHISGLIIDVNNYSKSNQFETWYSFNGYAILVNSKYVFVVEADFYHSKVLKKIKNNQRELRLKILKNKESICFYINDEIVYRLNKPSKYIKGKVGLYMNHSSVLFNSFDLKKI